MEQERSNFAFFSETAQHITYSTLENQHKSLFHAHFGYQFKLLLIAATPQQRINEHTRPAHTHLLLRKAHFPEEPHPTIAE